MHCPKCQSKHVQIAGPFMKRKGEYDPIPVKAHPRQCDCLNESCRYHWEDNSV